MGRSFVCVAVSLWCAPALALDWHVAPDGEGSGSEDDPASLRRASEDANAGDRIVLHEGYYGELSIGGQGYLLTAAEGEDVRARRVELRDATDVTVRGLRISRSFGPGEEDTMVSVHRSSSGVTVEQCEIFVASDEEVEGWSAEQWSNTGGNAMSSRAPDTSFLNNRIRNVGYGISIAHDSPRARVIGNVIDRFSKDGIRGIGDDGLYEGNVVMNVIDVDDHHDDLFQSWSVGEDGRPGTGVTRGVVIRNNFFLSFEDANQPFRGTPHAIGCFDGFFEDWVVENNVIITDHWHGITFMGARNMRIVNNTLLDNALGESPGPPWIRIDPHKDGRTSSGILVRNNIAQTIELDAEDVREDHNLRYDDAEVAELFVDASAYDLRLRPGSPAVDSGSADEAPAADYDGVPRPQGGQTDIGAFEWHDGTASPDAGPADSGAPARDGGVMNVADAGQRPADAQADAAEGMLGGGCRAGGAPSLSWAACLIALFLRRRAV